MADEVLVQVSYAIGVAEPMSINVVTYGTSKVNMSDSEIGDKTKTLFDMRPAAIIKRLKLKAPIYSDTAAYGHMGRTSEIKEVKFQVNGSELTKTVETFTWEKLDYVDKVKEMFGL